MKITKHSPAVARNEILSIAGFYLVFALMYYTTLWFNRGGYANPQDHYFNFNGFLNGGGLDYLLKFLLSLPIFWLMFFKLRNTRLSTRLLIHIITLPIFVLAWQKLYYFITEHIGMYHLTSMGQVWDLYIPTLFYILQFGVLHAYVYFKENQERLKLEADLKEAALKSELSALKAQLNPHFLYNVFNTINASVPPEMEQTRNMIAELSDLFRYQLQASKADLVSLRDELEFTSKYLQLEKARFEERLQVEIIASEDLMNTMIPPMLIQPLVENAIKHGIAPQIKGGTISIEVVKKGNALNVCIADTGQGIDDKNAVIGVGTGLTNTALRLNKMFGTAMQFTDTVPHGLTINFTIG